MAYITQYTYYENNGNSPEDSNKMLLSLSCKYAEAQLVCIFSDKGYNTPFLY